jgi:outer membrane protein with beta-barrel domain
MKAWRLGLSGILTLLVVCSVTPRPASAEFFLDFYGGASFTQDVDVELRGGATLDDQIEFDTTGTGGGRFGYWFTALGLPFLGVALDVSYFAPKATGVAINTRLEIVPVSGLVMLRLPLLASPAFPHGQLQPYVAGGPSLFVSDVKIDTRATGVERSDAQTEVGGDARAGITLLFTPNFGIFAEGRYTFFKANPGGLNTEFDVETFHALGGLTIRF